MAPSPTGYLHLGHARTFWVAQARARASSGILVLRDEDLDADRCRPEFSQALIEDLRWFGFDWQEGPDCGGPHRPYRQSQRRAFYFDALRKLLAADLIYPCQCSRQDVLRALQAPHQGEDEPIYPGTCRQEHQTVPTLFGAERLEDLPPFGDVAHRPGRKINWRFRVPDGEAIRFVDGALGLQAFAAGKDFGDFVVWRHDGVPAYQLAVVVDDALMEITEVVRGEDLLRSTARQLLLYRVLGWTPPAFHHCPLLTDEAGVRLAKRHDALSLRRLRERGMTPEQLRAGWSAGSGNVGGSN